MPAFAWLLVIVGGTVLAIIGWRWLRDRSSPPEPPIPFRVSTVAPWEKKGGAVHASAQDDITTASKATPEAVGAAHPPSAAPDFPFTISGKGALAPVVGPREEETMEQPLNNQQPAIRVTISTSDSSWGKQSDADIGALTPAGDSAWVLNPNSPLPITVAGATKDLAMRLRELLNTVVTWSEKLPEIAFLIARHNLRFKEVDEFVAQYKPRFSAEMARSMKESNEWANASDKDKLDLLAEFRGKAVASLGVSTGHADLGVLLTGEPTSLTEDDVLLQKFEGNSELYSFYLSQLGRTKSVVNVKADAYFRKSWETLVEKGLARRGKDIPKADLLSGLSLKDLNEMMAGAIPKPLGRRAKSVETALSLPDLDARLAKHISFRETFQVVPPADIDVSALVKAFNYANTIGQVLQQTFYTGSMTLKALGEREAAGPGMYDAWKITNWNHPPPSCAAQYLKKYGDLPLERPPFHVGCDCMLECSLKDE